MTVVSSATPGQTPPPPTSDPADDAFASAFAEHAGNVSEGNLSLDPMPLAPTPPAADAPAADTPPAGDNPPAPAGDAPPATPPAGDTPPAPAAGDAPATPPATDLVQQFKDLMDAARGTVSPPPPPAQVTPTPPPETPVYTAEEQALIAEYEKNWPDVASAETLRRRGEYAQLLQYVFSQVAQYITPVMTDVQELRNVAHLQQLKGAVPDYSDTLETEVAKWVDTQPSYLKSAYASVMQSGTSDEVADLIGRYRAATGNPASAPAPTGGQPAPAATPAPAPKRETELSRAAKQAAASLAPVGSERTSVQAGQDPGDFDSAFARFAAEAGG